MADGKRRRGFGPNSSWAGIYDVVDHFAAVSPRAPAIEDASGAWTYLELREASLRASAALAQHGLARLAAPAPDWQAAPPAPQPLALLVARDREFYALCLGAWRLGLPVVAMSQDMADKEVERSRNEQIMTSLRPVALVSSDDGKELLANFPDVPRIDIAEILAALREEQPPTLPTITCPTSPESVMVYVYTGGTTKASKCVTVTHAMALWEAENYSIVFGGRAGAGDKFLQYSSLYWGAAVFGQISSGLSVGACICIGGCPQGCGRAGDALQQIVSDVKTFGITILGIVPSQLRGAWPGGPSTAPRSVRTLIVWADKCPVELSRPWREHGIQVLDLLIASEYWLALYSDCSVWNDAGVEKHIYRALPSLEARFLLDAGTNGSTGTGAFLRDAAVGEVGEMYLTGPTVSPGYVCPDGRVGLGFYHAARTIDGTVYLRSRDQLRLLPDGGLVYAGRADSLMKQGGKWVDADALQDKVNAVPGVTQSAVVSSPVGVDAFVVMHSGVLDGGVPMDGSEGDSSPAKKLCVRGELPSAPFRVLASVRRVLPNARIHVCTQLPLHSATGKINNKALAAQLESRQQERQTHVDGQIETERRHVRTFKSWGRLAVSLVCGPQVIASVIQGVRNVVASAGTSAHVSSITRMCGSCASKLAVLPEIWAACAYIEFMLNPPGSPWNPPNDSLARILKRVGLSRSWSRWLPIILAALLPPPWLALTGAAACSWLGFRRERDLRLAIGFGSIGAGITSSMLPEGLRATTSLAGPTLGLLGASLAAMAPHAREFVSFLLSTPGLFYQVIPKHLMDDYHSSSLITGPLRSLAEQPPAFDDHMVWDDKVVVVDAGNTWDHVCLAGPRGESPWNSQGLVVTLHERLLGSDAVVIALSGAAAGSSGGQCNGAPTPSSSPLAALVERICGGADALHGMDSMQAIQLAEGVRREFGKALSVTDVLGAADIEQLEEVIKNTTSEAAPAGAASSVPEKASRREDDSIRRIWLCGMGPRACTVDWLFGQDDRTRHLDIPAMRRAVDRLVDRHGALRARNADEQPMFMPTYDAASLWQLWCSSGESWTRSRLGRWASESIFQAWPRSKLLPVGTQGAQVPLLHPRVSDVVIEGWQPSNDELAFSVGYSNYARREQNGQLFAICLVPIFEDAGGADPYSDAVDVALTLPPDQVQWYLYAVLDHGYCDGPAGLPLFADLLRLYAQEAGLPEAEPPADVPDALGVLQQRLRQSLKPLPEADHPNDDIAHDGLVEWGNRPGLQRFIQFDATMMQLLRYAACNVLGCSVDVAWLTAIATSFLRMFPKLRRLDLYLVVTCRDKPAEETMVGYFSSRKLLPLEVGDSSAMAILGLSDLISTARRQRNWVRPRPYEKSSRACVEVNVVGQAAAGLPCGFREIRYARSAPRSWTRAGTSCMQIRLDQAGRDAWDFRLQTHDGKWGDYWSTYYVQALGSAIFDMASRPFGPVVHPSPYATD